MRCFALDDYGHVFANSPAKKRLEQAGHIVQTTPHAPRGKALVEMLAPTDKPASEHADVAILTQQRTPIGAEEMKALRNLKFILNSGRSSSHLDLKAAEEQGIQILLEGQGDASPTAELTWALILASARKIVENTGTLRTGAWQASPAGTGLAGKTLGVLGLGRIGSRVARVGGAFGMNIIAYGRPGGAAEKLASESGYHFTSDKSHVFEKADFLTIHIKANKETEGLVAAEDLALMKPTATLINTSRSGVIAPGALEAALKSGRPGFAAIDVYDMEPVLDCGMESLLQLPNVLATPHLGYCTCENLDKIYDSLVDAFLEKGPSKL